MNAELLSLKIEQFRNKGGAVRYIPLGTRAFTPREMREAVRGDNLSAPSVCSPRRWDERAPRVAD